MLAEARVHEYWSLKTYTTRGAAMAQWIHLRLLSCCLGFKSQADHLHFNQFIFELYHLEKTKINKKKWPGLTQI